MPYPREFVRLGVRLGGSSAQGWGGSNFFLVGVNTADLTRTAELIDAGHLQTNVGAVLPLVEARRAHEMLEGTRPRPRGKIVLKVAG